LSGKTTVANLIANSTKGKILNLVTLAESIRGSLETEEGPFEGRIPDADVEKALRKVIMDDVESG